jgi:large subunit ribosomal protein L4
MKLSIYSQAGKKSTKQVDVADQVFGAEVNKNLLKQYVYIYLSNQREAIAHTKDRADVSGGGKKPHAQKGTGRARAGSNRSPLWRHGGVTFGPINERNWKKSLNKKMRKQALCSAISLMVKQDKLKVVDAIKLENDKLTKQAVDLITSFGSPRKVTLVAGSVNKDLLKAFANLPKTKVTLVSELNAYEVLNAGELIFMQDALPFTDTWQLAGAEEEVETTEEKA